MTSPSPHEVTRLLIDWSNGDESALDKLTPLVYDELRRLPHHYMSRERDGHTLQITALVNQAYLRLVDQKKARWAVPMTIPASVVTATRVGASVSTFEHRDDLTLYLSLVDATSPSAISLEDSQIGKMCDCSRANP